MSFPRSDEHIHDEVFRYLLSQPGLSAVAYGQELSTKALQSLLCPIEIPDASDDEPLLALGKFLQSHAPLSDQWKGANVENKAPQASAEFMGKFLKLRKKFEKKSLLQRILESPVADPIPPHLRPFEQVVLTAQEIRSTPRLTGKKKNPGPKKLAELFRRGGKYQIASKIPMTRYVEEQVDPDKALNMKLSFTEDVIQGAQQFRNTLIKDLGARMAARPKFGEEAEWDKWKQESIAKLDTLPRSISPPLFPMCPPRSASVQPLTYSEVKEHALGDVLRKDRDETKEIFEQQDESIAPENIVQLLKSSMTGFSQDDHKPLDDPMALSLLDEWDDTPYESLTPSSKSSHRTPQSRRSTTTAREIDFQSCIRPSRASRKKMPWEELYDFEPTLMPFKRNLRWDDRYDNQILPTSTMMPKVEAQYISFSNNQGRLLVANGYVNTCDEPMQLSLPGMCELGSQTTGNETLSEECVLQRTSPPQYHLHPSRDGVWDNWPMSGRDPGPSNDNSYEEIPSQTATRLSYPNSRHISHVDAGRQDGGQWSDRAILNQIQIIRVPQGNADVTEAQEAISRSETGVSDPTERLPKRFKTSSPPSQVSQSLDDLVRLKASKISDLDRKSCDFGDARLSASHFFQLRLQEDFDPDINFKPTSLEPASLAEMETAEEKLTQTEDWKSSLAIRNPRWYFKAEGRSLNGSDTSTPILAGINILQSRSLTKGLRTRFKLVEREATIQGVDLVLSASTGVIFRRLTGLEAEAQGILEILKQAFNYYRRIILVFEVVPYGPHTATASQEVFLKPLSQVIRQALPRFRRAAAVLSASDGVKASLDMVFAMNGPDEVSKVIRNVAEEEFDILRTTLGEREARVACGDRAWLYTEENEEAKAMIDSYGLNSFATLYILFKRGSFDGFAFDMNDDERLRHFGTVVGEKTVQRFNQLLQSRLGGLGETTDNGPISSSDPIANIAHDESAEWGSFRYQ